MSESFPRRARLWRYLGYAAGALMLLALVLVVGTWLAVRAWGPEFARERLETALTSALGRPTRVEQISIQPWLGRVVIGNVTAGALPGEPGPHFFKLGRLDVNFAISSLWRRRLDPAIDRARRSRPHDPGRRRPRAARDPDAAGGRAGRPVEVELGTIELRRGRLVYDDPATATRIRVQGITASLVPGRAAMSATVAAQELALDVEKIHERARAARRR